MLTFRRLRPLAGGVLFVLAVLASPPNRLRAQPLNPEVELTAYVREVWQVEDGLPQNSVYAIEQAWDGHLWVGTQGGLARFDGTEFVVIDQVDTPWLGSNEVWALLTDGAGALWVGTAGGGLSRVSEEGARVFTEADGLESNFVRVLYDGGSGTLWAGTIGGGLFRYNGERFTRYGKEELPSDNVLSVTEAEKGVLLVGTDEGLVRLEGEEVAVIGRQEGLPGQMVRALARSADDAVWVGTDEGLARYQEGRLAPYPLENPRCGRIISALYEDASGALWVGSLDGALCRLYKGKVSVLPLEEELSHGQVRSIHQSADGSLWIGTDGAGLLHLRQGRFVTLSSEEGLSSDAAMTVIKDPSGVLWVGTGGGGLNRIEGEHITYFGEESGLPSDYVYALHTGRDGDLWVGLYDGGLCRYEEGPSGDGRFACFGTEDGLPSDNVFLIHEDRAGDLWVGTDRGLGRLREDSVTTFTTEDGLESDYIMALQEDPGGGVWVGTYGGGLSLLRDGEVLNFEPAEGDSVKVVLTFHEDLDHPGTYWIGTKEKGLCHFDRRRLRCFTSRAGLPTNSVLQVLEDDVGRFWLGTHKGIVRVSKEALLAQPASEEEQVIDYELYGREDGLKSIDLVGGTQPAAYRSDDGRLWFSTLGGVASVDPTAAPAPAAAPHVVLRRFAVDGVEAADGGRDVLAGSPSIEWPVKVPAGARGVELEYAAISVAAPGQVRYQYRLEGYDRDWVKAGGEQRARYMNLEPDAYQFWVRASSRGGPWGEPALLASFRVAPFFYETWWFLMTCVALLALGAVGVHRLRTQKLRRREETLKALVAEKTHELAELNEGLSEEVRRQIALILTERVKYENELVAAKEEAEAAAHMKSAMLASVSHEVRTPLTAILGYSEILMEELGEHQQEFVSYIKENGERLLETLNSILDVARLEVSAAEMRVAELDLTDVARKTAQVLAPLAERKGICLRVEGSEEAVMARLDHSAVTRILNNLVGNAIKFTEAGEVVITTAATAEKAVLSVRDTGVGINQEFMPYLFDEFTQESAGLDRSHEGSGLGLAITKRLVEMAGGTITAESRRGEGTTFTVSFPKEGPPEPDGRDGGEDQWETSHAKGAKPGSGRRVDGE